MGIVCVVRGVVGRAVVFFRNRFCLFFLGLVFGFMGQVMWSHGPLLVLVDGWWSGSHVFPSVHGAVVVVCGCGCVVDGVGVARSFSTVDHRIDNRPH